MVCHQHKLRKIKVNAKRKKQKERRRARKLSEQAWDAVEEGNLDLALKIIRRAVDAQIENPILWHDLGVILLMVEDEPEAEASFRAAISLAPDYAEPYARLADIRFRRGFIAAAVELQEKAVQFSDGSEQFKQKLEAYRAVLGPEEVPVSMDEKADLTFNQKSVNEWTARLDELPWEKLGEELTRTGCVHLPSVVDPEYCASLRESFSDDALFAKTVVMDRVDFGLGTYRYFRAPILEIVDQLRRAFYPHVASVANDWERMLGRENTFPEDWHDFETVCHDAGQCTPTPILLRYEAGGFNSLHRDLRGQVFFPIQMAVILSATPDDFDGGEFLFCDVPESKKAKRRVIEAGLGDVLLFCTRDRLVSVGGAYGLQPVKHGVAEITQGTRYVLGVPFHEYR